MKFCLKNSSENENNKNIHFWGNKVRKIKINRIRMWRIIKKEND